MRNGVTDDQILALVKRGMLKWENGHIYKLHRRWGRFIQLKPRLNHWDRWTYQIQLRHDGKSKARSIQANRLVYIVFYKRIPEGDVDHMDEDKHNNHPSNLQDLDPTVNRRKNTRVGFEVCCEFFDRLVAVRSGSLGDF